MNKFEIHCRPHQGVTFVTTPSGRFDLRPVDAEAKRDILNLAYTLYEAGMGSAGGWPMAYARGWIDAN